jgi:hypothetical protein
MRRMVVVLAMTAALASTGAEAEARTRSLTGTERALVENAIKEMLVDPDSARFEIKPFLVGAALVCGRFNSKNRLGGYTGYDPFEVQVTTNAQGTITAVRLPQHYSWGDEESSAIVAASHCQDAGSRSARSGLRVSS